MSEARIQYREQARGVLELWGIRVGTRTEIRESAEDLLADLREEAPRASVFVNGKRIQLSKNGGR